MDRGSFDPIAGCWQGGTRALYSRALVQPRESTKTLRVPRPISLVHSFGTRGRAARGWREPRRHGAPEDPYNQIFIFCGPSAHEAEEIKTRVADRIRLFLDRLGVLTKELSYNER